MSGSNLTLDGEIRYIIQWFNEWSELQREDFVPVFVEYLKMNEGYVNGLVAGMDNASCADKPMSLFQCRVKLFREWSKKWPEATKERLKEKLTELDSGIMEKIEEELKLWENGQGHTTNGDVAAEELPAEDNVPEPLITINDRPDEIVTA